MQAHQSTIEKWLFSQNEKDFIYSTHPKSTCPTKTGEQVCHDFLNN